MTSNLLQRVRSDPAHRTLLASVRGAMTAIAERQRPDAPSSVLVAVSGGSDSVALLVLLRAACSRARVQLTGAYVNHGLRDAAFMEAALVAGLCRRLDVPFLTTEIARLSHPSEAHLREARYAALDRLATRSSAHWIATGHTRDDQIETILFRLLRGSSRLGAAGMRPLRDNVVRPLLGLRRTALRACLRDAGIGWIDDPSNATLTFTRNKIRSLVIPAVERAMGDGRLEHLTEVADLWRDEDSYLESEAARFAAYALRGHGPALHLDVAAMSAVPSALRPRLIRNWLRGFGVNEIPLTRLRAVMGLLEDSGESRGVEIGGVTVGRDYGALRVLEAAPRPFTLEQDLDLEHAAWFGGPNGEWTLSIDPQPIDDPPAAGSSQRQIVEFPSDLLAAPVRLRHSRPGDAIRTQVHGRRKVHDIMIEARVPRRERSTWPVLTSADALIWVPGLAVAAEMESALRRKGGRRVRFAWQRSSQ